MNHRIVVAVIGHIQGTYTRIPLYCWRCETCEVRGSTTHLDRRDAVIEADHHRIEAAQRAVKPALWTPSS